HGAFRSSATWTSSSGDLASFSDTDEIEDRTRFVLEYNRLAKKHGIRVMVMGDFGNLRQSKSVPNIMPEQKGWLSRIWHRASIGQTDSQSRSLRHRRSFSDLAGQIMQPKPEPPKTQSLQSMVTLGGKSLLYLPSEFAPRALVLPTCFRATAQFLVQNGVVTRGVFRISGSLRVVNALYDYYYHVDADEEITQTIRCPNLPLHIKAGVHDVASTFKRFLGSLPGGILGSLALFDALIAIHSQLRGEPELNRTRQTKLRARLIAMAIGTIKSQFRRELICAVFGLLSLIGRQAELTPHEDVQGHPLPTSDLMGYSALGIVFGPLLVGNLLDSYTMKVAHPPAGLLLFPLTPTKLKKERAQKVVAGEGPPTVNKIHVANDIAEMLITHWREVVRHLDNLGVLTVKNKDAEDMPVARSFPRSTTSDSLFTGGPQRWSVQNFEVPDIRDSPDYSTPTRQSDARAAAVESEPALSVKRMRPKAPGSVSLNRVSVRQSLNPLSPTAEESMASED
ncbi:GTPase-activator protein for rho-like GTPases-like protein, partial [Plectosphaerella plurivora]